MELRLQDPIFRGNEFTLKFLRSGKVVAKLHTENCHYTLHPGHATGSLDVHKTNELLLPDDPAKYETLAGLPHGVLIERLNAIGYPLLSEFCRLWRPLRLSWMIHRRLAIGPRIPTDDQFPDVTGIKTREGPSQSNDQLAASTKPPEFYDEIVREPNTAYLLYDWRKRSSLPYGVVVTYASAERRVGMLWAKTRDLSSWSRRWESSFLAIWNLARENSSSLSFVPGTVEP